MATEGAQRAPLHCMTCPIDVAARVARGFRVLDAAAFGALAERRQDAGA